jgi:hypothetical protein
MPNGKIYIVVSGFKKGKRVTEIYELNKRDWHLEKRKTLDQYLFYLGAVASTVNNKIMLSGSQLGKTKSAIMLDINSSKIQSDDSSCITTLPDLNFGRYNHAMTVLEQRFLFVFGGSFV